MTTLTLDKSRNALAVLAWRRGLTRKPFAPLRILHKDAKAIVVQHRALQHGKSSLTTKQSLRIKGKR